MALQSGIPSVIASGFEAGVLSAAVAGKPAAPNFRQAIDIKPYHELLSRSDSERNERVGFSLKTLRHIDPGFSGAQEVETLRLSIPESQVQEPERAVRMEEQILHRIEALPRYFGRSHHQYTSMEGGPRTIRFTHGSCGAGGRGPPDPALQIRLRELLFRDRGPSIAGRDLTWAETSQQRAVALVSENVRANWRDRGRRGKRIRPTLKDDWRK